MIEPVLYESSLEATPQSATFLFDLGAVLEQKGDLMQAAAYYEQTLDINPHYERESRAWLVSIYG
jgi:predicted TPR repeat methyltransferase